MEAAQICGAGEALDELIAACPSFLGAEDLYVFQALFEDGGDPDFFLRVASFAQHLVALVGDGRLDEVRAVAAAIDEVLVHGDAAARELIEMGLIEHLQNIVSHLDVTVTSDQVEVLLGPEARQVWRRVDELWVAAGVHASAVRTSESDYDRVMDPNLRLYFRAHTRALPDGRLLSSADVYRQEQRVVERFRARQRAAMRLIAVGVLVVLVLLVIAASR